METRIFCGGLFSMALTLVVFVSLCLLLRRMWRLGALEDKGRTIRALEEGAVIIPSGVTCHVCGKPFSGDWVICKACRRPYHLAGKNFSCLLMLLALLFWPLALLGLTPFRKCGDGKRCNECITRGRPELSEKEELIAIV